MQNLIEFHNVDKGFEVDERQVPVLHDINLAIKPNSFVIIYGPSGSGKSTLLNIIMGLEPPTKGIVRIDGREIYAESTRARALYRSQNLGAIYQTMYWIKSLTVLQNVALPLSLSGKTRGESHRIALEKLKQVGMDAFAHYMPALLSGGQQQRVAMARALVAEPTMIVADEPTGNLDSKTGDAAMNLLMNYHRSTGCTIILVTHNLEYLSLSKDRYYMQDGRLKLDTDIHTTEHVSRLVSQMRNRLDRGERGQVRDVS